MADLVKIKLGDNEQQRTEDLNDNFAEIEERKVDKTTNGYATLGSDGKVTQTAKTSDKATYFDDTSVTIAAALAGLAAEIEDIEDGTTIVAKAKALQPDSAPGNLKYYGTNSAGQVGWWDYTPGTQDPTGQTTFVFAADDEDWTQSGDYWTLAIPHGSKYPGDVYKVSSGDYYRVIVGLKRTSTNVVITSDDKFAGYLLLS